MSDWFNCEKKYWRKLNSLILKSPSTKELENDKKYIELSIKYNKCISKQFLMILGIIFIIPFLSELIYYLKNKEFDLNLFLIVWKFSLLFFWFVFIWYITIRIYKYQNWFFLVWFLFALIVYIMWFFIYFKFDDFFMFLANNWY